MVPELDPTLIDKFRSKVHDNNEFVRLFFVDYGSHHGVEGKDIWSKICSCMDWLTVAVEEIEYPLVKNSNQASLRFTHFLVTIDMIVEAVNHLWLSIGQVNKIKQPYLKNRDIFKGNEFGWEYTDEKYFKEIRSWFGVHAVNGNEVELKEKSKKVRFFSSWSFNSFNKDDEYYIMLYSNNKWAEEKYGGSKKVRIDNLLKFAALRYETINLLIDESDRLYLDEKKRLQNMKVIFDPSDSELNQIKHLYTQAKERKLTEEFYEYLIQDYISFLSCDLADFKENDRKVVEEYLIALKPVIPTYLKIIQEVDDQEYEIFDLFDVNSEIYRDNSYDFSKVLEFAGGGENYMTASISLEMLIEKEILPEYCSNISRPALDLLIHALEYKWRNSETKEF